MNFTSDFLALENGLITTVNDSRETAAVGLVRINGAEFEMVYQTSADVRAPCFVTTTTKYFPVIGVLVVALE